MDLDLSIYRQLAQLRPFVVFVGILVAMLLVLVAVKQPSRRVVIVLAVVVVLKRRVELQQFQLQQRAVEQQQQLVVVERDVLVIERRQLSVQQRQLQFIERGVVIGQLVAGEQFQQRSFVFKLWPVLVVKWAVQLLVFFASVEQQLESEQLLVIALLSEFVQQLIESLQLVLAEQPKLQRLVVQLQRLLFVLVRSELQ